MEIDGNQLLTADSLQNEAGQYFYRYSLLFPRL